MPEKVQQNIPLAPYTTLGVGGRATYSVDVSTEEELHDVVQWAQKESLPIMILGGGSNVLVRDKGFEGVVIRPCIKGITYREDTLSEDVFVTAGAGVVLDEFIEVLVQKGLWGLENLSSIPGMVGAVPVQNVGAYGVEAKDVVHEVIAYNMHTHTIETLSHTACAFAYRDSIFKQLYSGTHVITAVTFRVSKKPRRILSYKDITAYFGTYTTPTLSEVRNAVSAIRSQKFPDWHVVGTAGSFFKNPVVDEQKFRELQIQYPEVPGYKNEHGGVKISLGWILEHVCQVKGYTRDGVGLFEKQALVLVCEKGMSAEKVEKFSADIIDLVFEKTGVLIEREVRIVGE